MTAPIPSGGMPSLLPPGQSAGTLPPTTAVAQPPQPMQQLAPGVGLKPGTQTPPAAVLQVVKQVSVQLFSYLRCDPGGGTLTYSWEKLSVVQWCIFWFC